MTKRGDHEEGERCKWKEGMCDRMKARLRRGWWQGAVGEGTKPKQNQRKCHWGVSYFANFKTE